MDLRWHFNTALVKTAIKLLKWSGWYEGYWNYWRGEAFSYAQKHGLHILPVHYYSPIPDTDKLSASMWNKKSNLIGLDLNLNFGLELLHKLSEGYQNEYTQFPLEPTSKHQQFYLNNSAYRRGDAEILYSMVRYIKPRKIIEIGSGRTTLLMSQAIRQNQQEDREYCCEFTAIEPYPPEYLNPLPAEVSQLLSTNLQDVTVEKFQCLESGDILFIDSTHVSNIGSDVVYEYLEILPCLSKGVIIHIDDIFLPMNYPKDWIDKSRFFWNEQYLLQAFLAFNQEFKIIMPTHALNNEYPEIIKSYIPSLEQSDCSPSSFWLEKI